MNPHYAFLLMLALTLCWLAVPLLPALIELHRKSDAEPLAILQDEAGDIRHFAHSFRQSVRSSFQELAEAGFEGGRHEYVLPGGGKHVLVRSAPGLLSAAEMGEGVAENVLLLAHPLALPARIKFAREVYAAGELKGGEACLYTAVFGEKKVELSAGSEVQRWIHAEGELACASDCKLRGRASSENLIRFARDCEFQRVQAPRIEFGPGAPQGGLLPASANGASIIDVPPQRSRVKGAFESPSGAAFDGSIVASGQVEIGARGSVSGCIKSSKDVIIGPESKVLGSIVSARDVYLRADSRIHGPVIAERAIFIARGCTIGSPASPTTMTAQFISAESGAAAFGTVWARQLGRVGA